MGGLLGHAVRFGIADDVLAAGEGIETMLSLRTVLPSLPVAAALSANHLATLLWLAHAAPLYVAVDADAAGITAAKALTVRALDAASRQSPSILAWGISTKICAPSGKPSSGTCCAISCCGRTPRASWT